MNRTTRFGLAGLFLAGAAIYSPGCGDILLGKDHPTAQGRAVSVYGSQVDYDSRIRALKAELEEIDAQKSKIHGTDKESNRLIEQYNSRWITVRSQLGALERERNSTPEERAREDVGRAALEREAAIARMEEERRAAEAAEAAKRARR